jgi:hypothetical protein
MKREPSGHLANQHPQGRAECPHPAAPSAQRVINNGGMGTFRPTTGEACELLILADGTVLARNLTEEMAAILSRVAPQDSSLQQRAGRSGKSEGRSSKAEIRDDNDRTRPQMDTDAHG